MIKHEISLKRKIISKVVVALIWAALFITISLLGIIVVYVFYKGLTAINLDFLGGTRTSDHIGILPNILYTLYIILTTLLIALPVGVGAAIFLNEYANGTRFAKIIEFITEVLAGIPSIIYGLVGFGIFIAGMSWTINIGSFSFTLGLPSGRPSVLVGSLTLSMLVLPTIVRVTGEALKTVPRSQKEGAAALGAPKWHTIRTIILPYSKDGILGGIILAIGRMAGESAALLFTAGMGFRLVTNYFEAVNVPGATLSVALFTYVTEQNELEVAFAVAAMLIIFVLTLNLLVKLIKKIFSKGEQR